MEKQKPLNAYYVLTEKNTGSIVCVNWYQTKTGKSQRQTVKSRVSIVQYSL